MLFYIYSLGEIMLKKYVDLVLGKTKKPIGFDKIVEKINPPLDYLSVVDKIYFGGML